MVVTLRSHSVMIQSFPLDVSYDARIRSSSDAINVFLHKSIIVGGMPFEVRVQPNEETLMAIREAEDILAGRTQTKRYTSARELFDELDAETDDETC